MGPAHAAAWKPRNPTQWSPRDLDRTPAVGGRNAAPVKAVPLKGDGAPAWKAGAVAWPGAVDAEVDLAPRTATPKSLKES
ncbi:hypothetical protein ACWC5I_45385, partial [Kitasatospora sp. NPDC001574]